jgi:thiol-disulfide isomerase/thioredoxin
MTSTYMKTYLILAAFGISVATAQPPAKDPNAAAPAVKAAEVKPQAAQPDEVPMPAVRVGMPAPAFKVAQWFKGTPVEKLEPGKLYVVEFWATWCGPCRATIPHLTELAHKYDGKITFIGVDVWERPAEKTDEAIAAIVEPFVKEMGDKMNYNVAADGIEKTMATTWMTAAGQNGIPAAFVIGRDGKIAWIGHPMEMDKVLDELVAGTFDVQAEARRQEIEWRKQQARQKLEAPIRAALSARDNKAAVEAIDKAIAADPNMETVLIPVRFNALIQIDEPAAFVYLKALLEKDAFEKEPYNAFNAAGIVSQQAANLKNPDYVLVIAAMDKAKAAEQDNAAVLALYAEMLSHVGKVDQAIEFQQKAVQMAEPLVGQRFSQKWFDAQKARLDEYKAKRN